jgi:catechol 2,3-dioxygenase-like lactoylglutathione lyase family enzyme
LPINVPKTPWIRLRTLAGNDLIKKLMKAGDLMSVALNGIAHIQLTVDNPARCLPFWEKLCHFFEMQTLIQNENTLYCIGSRTGILVRGAPAARHGGPFDQLRAGLHHFCLRARSREDVDAVERFAEEIGAKIVHPAEEGSRFAPGYYSVLFEDPEGIRVEVNYVPGKGHFGAGGRLGPGGEGTATQYSEDGLKGSGNDPDTGDQARLPAKGSADREPAAE